METRQVTGRFIPTYAGILFAFLITLPAAPTFAQPVKDPLPAAKPLASRCQVRLTSTPRDLAPASAPTGKRCSRSEDESRSGTSCESHIALRRGGRRMPPTSNK